MKKTFLILISSITFSFTYSQDFIEKVIDNNFNDTLHAISVDLDGDGDKDIVGTAYTADEVAWYENDGAQNYTKHIIDNTIDGAIYVSAYDGDGDGDIDLVVNAAIGNTIYAFSNDGNQNFTKYTIDNNAGGTSYHTSGDFNGGGLVDDIVAANYSDNALVAYRLTFGIGGITLNKIIIDNNFNGVGSVEATDIDSDGDLDLLATAYDGDEIAWYENDGFANFTKHSIDITAIGAATAYPIDFDNDGDIDFIASISGRLLPTGGDEVAWYENDGSENFTKHSVDSASNYASFGQAADFDNDGDLDIVASATITNEMRWYESDGATPPNFTTHIILGGSIGDAYSIDLDDMDGDGWIDIVSAAPGNNAIRIFDNIIGSTIIPDLNFENYLETHNANGNVVTLGDSTSMGNGIANDHKVFTDRINTVVRLDISNQSIADITGIEDFTELIILNCSSNSITSFDISQNLELKQLYCNNNLLNTLDTSSNNLLERLNASFNNLTTIDVTNNINLITFYIGNNDLTVIDASQNSTLTSFNAQNNPNLYSLNIKNGNNSNINDTNFRIQNTSALHCIEVDDEVYSTNTWINYIDANHYFNNICGTIWRGSPATWTNGMPIDGTKDVGIEEPYNVGVEGNIYGKSLITSLNGDVLISDGSYVNIVENFENNASITVEQGGSFIQKNDDATVTGTGIFNVIVAINEIPENTSNPTQSARYTYFSSPTKNETLNVFSPWAEMSSLYSFNSTTQSWAAEASGNTMIPGIGYIVRTKNADTYPIDGSTAATGLNTFTGAFNNGIIVQNLVFNTGGADDDNVLLGNPYPSAISTAKIFSDNPSVESLHFWRHAEGADLSGNFNESYAVKTATGSTFGAPSFISTGQGFFVEANSLGTLTFKNDLRVNDNNNTFLSSSSLDKAWFNLKTPTGIEAQILIGFIPTCTDEFDNQHDAHNIDSGSYLSMYTNGIGTDTQNLVIQARAPLNGSDSVIPLGFDMNNANISHLTISLDHFENFNGYDIYLRDIQENILHNIKQGDYNFTVNRTGNFNNRFEILFNRNVASVNENISSKNNLIVSNIDNNTIKVIMNNGSIINKFEAYDILGKLIIQKTPKMNNFEIKSSIKSGTLLFIKATLENGQIISKKFIKI